MSPIRAIVEGKVRSNAMRVWQSILLVITIVLALGNLGLWIRSREQHVDEFSFSIWIAPHRELVVNVWGRVSNTSADTDRGTPGPSLGPLAITLWLRDSAAISISRIGSLTVPTWPLLVLSAILPTMAAISG